MFIYLSNLFTGYKKIHLKISQNISNVFIFTLCNKKPRYQQTSKNKHYPSTKNSGKHTIKNYYDLPLKIDVLADMLKILQMNP